MFIIYFSETFHQRLFVKKGVILHFNCATFRMICPFFYKSLLVKQKNEIITNLLIPTFKKNQHWFDFELVTFTLWIQFYFKDWSNIIISTLNNLIACHFVISTKSIDSSIALNKQDSILQTKTHFSFLRVTSLARHKNVSWDNHHYTTDHQWTLAFSKARGISK